MAQEAVHSLRLESGSDRGCEICVVFVFAANRRIEFHTASALGQQTAHQEVVHDGNAQHIHATPFHRLIRARFPETVTVGL